MRHRSNLADDWWERPCKSQNAERGTIDVEGPVARIVERSARGFKRLTLVLRTGFAGVVCMHGPLFGRVRVIRGASER